MSKVTRDAVHAARLEHRKALGLDASIKAAIERGETWQGADKASAAQRESTSSVADELQKEYDAQRLPIIRVAAENVAAAGKALAAKCNQEASILSQLGRDKIDLAEREAYFDLLQSELKADAGDNPHYANFLAAHSGSVREKLQAVRDRVAANSAEVQSVRNQRGSLQSALADAGESLAALAV